MAAPSEGQHQVIADIIGVFLAAELERAEQARTAPAADDAPALLADPSPEPSNQDAA